MPLNLTPEQRIMTRVVIDANGCWLWTSKSVNRMGYGYLRVNKVQWLAHRLAWTLFVGPIPTGRVLDHLCRVPACCNPEHLEPVTQKVNVNRGVAPNILTHATGICQRGHEIVGSNRMRGRCRRCNNDRRRLRYQEIHPLKSDEGA